MKKTLLKTTALIGLAFLSSAYADDATELARLRQENADLKKQLQAAQESQAAPASAHAETRAFAPMPVADDTHAADWKPTALKDFSVSIGTKVWVNRWDSSIAGLFIPASFRGLNQTNGALVYSDTNQTQMIHSDEQVTAIPTLNLRYKNFLLGGGYYSQTSFGFDPVSASTRLTLVGDGSVTDDNNYQQRQSYNAKREEWDINVGYALTPNIAFLTGYKSVRQHFDIQNSFSTQNLLTGRTTDANTENKQYIFDLDGPLLGLALSAPMAHGFGTYFNYMHGFMTEHHSDSNTGQGVSSAADYNLIEGGLSYSLDGNFIPAGTPISAAAIYAGYRYQWIEVQSDENRGNKDITQGFAAGLNLAF
ncbi:MAG: hypothetical protein ABL903_01255 [Methylococcales bacterium]